MSIIDVAPMLVALVALLISVRNSRQAWEFQRFWLKRIYGLEVLMNVSVGQEAYETSRESERWWSLKFGGGGGE